MTSMDEDGPGRVPVELGRRGDPCDFCGGSGIVPERHDHYTEWLSCQDCLGAGVVPEVSHEA